MTRDDIIDMAKEADIYANCEWEHSKNPKQWKQCRDEHFADLLISTEREACAQLLEGASRTGKIISCTSAAAAIRARGQA